MSEVEEREGRAMRKGRAKREKWEEEKGTGEKLDCSSE